MTNLPYCEHSASMTCSNCAPEKDRPHYPIRPSSKDDQGRCLHRDGKGYLWAGVGDHHIGYKCLSCGENCWPHFGDMRFKRVYDAQVDRIRALEARIAELEGHKT